VCRKLNKNIIDRKYNKRKEIMCCRRPDPKGLPLLVSAPSFVLPGINS
jgi:hypothetical protein